MKVISNQLNYIFIKKSHTVAPDSRHSFLYRPKHADSNQHVSKTKIYLSGVVDLKVTLDEPLIRSRTEGWS